VCLRCQRERHVSKDCDTPFCMSCKKFGHVRDGCNVFLWEKTTNQDTVLKVIAEGSEILVDKVVSPTVANETVTEENYPKLPTAETGPVSPVYAMSSPVWPASGESSPKLIIDETATHEESSDAPAEADGQTIPKTDKTIGVVHDTATEPDAVQETLLKVVDALNSESAEADKCCKC
jgi:hypothetical protein